MVARLTMRERSARDLRAGGGGGLTHMSPVVLGPLRPAAQRALGPVSRKFAPNYVKNFPGFPETSPNIARVRPGQRQQ